MTGEQQAVIDAAIRFSTAYKQNAKRWPNVTDWPEFIASERALDRAVDALLAARDPQ